MILLITLSPEHQPSLLLGTPICFQLAISPPNRRRRLKRTGFNRCLTRNNRLDNRQAVQLEELSNLPKALNQKIISSILLMVLMKAVVTPITDQATHQTRHKNLNQDLQVIINSQSTIFLRRKIFLTSPSQMSVHQTLRIKTSHLGKAPNLRVNSIMEPLWLSKQKNTTSTSSPSSVISLKICLAPNLTQLVTIIVNL